MPEDLVSRDGFGSPVSRQPAHLHTQTESGAYLRDSSRVPPRRPYIYLIRHTPSSQSQVYRVTQLRTAESPLGQGRSKPQGSSERVLPYSQVTMDQLIYAFLSHTHYWYEVGMLKVPAECSITVGFSPDVRMFTLLHATNNNIIHWGIRLNPMKSFFST